MAVTVSWITKDFLENALKEYFKGNVSILGFTTSDVVPIGENFTSDLLRISVLYSLENGIEHQELSLIAKCFPEDDERRSAVTSLKCFCHELKIYAEVLPEINTLDNSRKVAPDVIYISTQPYPVLLLEDLKILSYKMQSREIGLDLDHCLLVVEKLAYFHASSVAVLKKNPQIIERYDIGFSLERESMIEFTSNCLSSLIEACEETPAFHRYARKLKFMNGGIVQKIHSSVKPSPNFNVLNHGDAWTNNMMFLHENNDKSNDVVFVDFQFPLYSSPTLDLHYFWATSPNIEVKNQHRETVINHYFEEVVKTLLKLRVDVTLPTREEFDNDFRSRAAYGLMAMVQCLPLAKGNRRKDGSIGNFADCHGIDSFRYECFHNEIYTKELECLLPFYDSLGVFD